MQEDINYSSMVFKDRGHPPEENKKLETIYAEVKSNCAPTAVPSGEAAAASSNCAKVLAVCVVALSILLVSSISAIIYMNIVMSHQEKFTSDLMAEREKLTDAKVILKRNVEKLSRVVENVNWTLGVILKFNNFPVNQYCPNKKCQPCLSGWIQFQDKCYLFYEKHAPWKTWPESRTYCKNEHADLVVVGSLQEQEFISNHSKPYYDSCHGYWMGLNETKDNSWVWVDGSNDTLSLWVSKELGTRGPFGLMIPGRNVTDSWDKAESDMRNKFICEGDALIKSPH